MRVQLNMRKSTERNEKKITLTSEEKVLKREK